MDEKSKIERINDVFQKYTEIWKQLSFLFVVGIVTLIVGIILGSNYISFLGIALLIGSFTGIFFGVYFGFSLGWIVPIIINLFIGVYLAFVLFGTHEAVFASYVSPIIGGLTGWYSSRRRIFLDGGAESDFFKNKRSLFSDNK
ncbi:MAG: hypothetical protein ACQEQM_00375 [Thermoplasmatota archaeon]